MQAAAAKPMIQMGGQQELTTLPPLRQELGLFPGPRQPDGSPTWSVHDPIRNRFFRIGWLEFEILKRWDRIGDADPLIEEVLTQTTLRINKSHLEQLLKFLMVNQLLQSKGGETSKKFASQIAASKQNIFSWLLHHYLFFRIPLLKPNKFLEATLPHVRFFFTKRFIKLLIPLALIGLYLVMRQWDLFTQTFLYFFSAEGFAYFIMATVFTKLVHEGGHAYACKHNKINVPNMGIAFMVMWPVFYTDTSETWKLVSRWARLQVAAAGIMAELALAVIAILLWSFLPDGPVRSATFYVASVSWITTLMINLSPFMRFDGYYLLADFLDITNMQPRSFAIGRWKIRRLLLGLQEPFPEPGLPKRTRRIMMWYAYGTWLYRLTLFIGIALLVYNMFFKLAGVVLMAVEILFFVTLPIFRELKHWFQIRQMIHFNLNIVITTLILAGLITLSIIPWSTQIEASALMKSREHSIIYPPLSGQLDKVHVQWGSHVRRGEPLFTMSSPDLTFEKDQALTRIQSIRAQIASLIAREKQLSSRQILEQQLAETMATLQGVKEQLSKLVITAPFDGVIAELDETLRAGRWLNEDQQLGLLINPRQAQVAAFVYENDLTRIQLGGFAKLYPENPDLEPIPLTVRSIDPSNTRIIEEMYLSSIYGGDIAVRQGEKGEMISNETIYRVLLQPPESFPLPAQAMRGTVQMQGTPLSLIERAWTVVSAVVIRESGGF
ncbi:MAG: efflux RND transporter periplasmic adaptor subunit [Magnetococcales bacterium]|nr:efflux RND transporter periplasmic adaptor subunit [Magnetococcales bacterium]